jgi:hypothetical protein
VAKKYVFVYRNDSRVFGPFNSEQEALNRFLGSGPNELFETMEDAAHADANGDFFVAELEDPDDDPDRLEHVEVRDRFPEAWDSWVDEIEDPLRVLDDYFSVDSQGRLWVEPGVPQPAWLWTGHEWVQPDTSF